MTGLLDKLIEQLKKLPSYAWLLIAATIIWYARACHHILLYETMARRVIHYRVNNSSLALLAFDVSLRQTVPKASSEKDSIRETGGA
jgi:hypothetical protein